MTLHEYARKAVAARDYVADWLQAKWRGTPEHVRLSARRRAAEFATEAATVDRALALDTPEADVQLTVQLAAWDQEISRLLTLPRARTAEENRQLASMTQQRNRMQARLLGAGAVPEARLADFGDVGQRRGFLGALAGGGVMQWVAAGGAAIGLLGFTTAAVQGARLNHAKADLAEARADLASREKALADRTAERDILADNVREAAAGAQQAAQTIETERARANAARRRERELLNEIQSRTRDVGDPPAWSLRDGEGGDPAGSGDRASGDSDQLPR